MEIRVAGFNCDIESIEKRDDKDITCETIAASYARISRDPRHISEIRRDAREDVKSARDLNRRVVFDMGHSSIAEHAVFNLDIIGISRLAAEYVERFRLASYTEKSQRYIKLGEDFVIPDNLPADLKDSYISFVKDSFSLYEEIYQKILPMVKEKKGHQEGLKKRDIEGLAMEDARYVLPLSVTTQLGLTANARNIEYMIKVLSSSPISELQSIAKAIYNEAIKYAPSLIRYTEPEEYFRRYFYSLKSEPTDPSASSICDLSDDGVNLLSVCGDQSTLLGLLLFYSSNLSFEEAIRTAQNMSNEERLDKVYSIFRMLSKHHPLPRIFESVTLEYELTMSASCFAQFKRHRMMTQIAQPYNFKLGFELPILIKEAGFHDRVLEHSKRAISLYNQIYQRDENCAPYVILNGHRRRVYANLNARELYHISRLRMDHHAQWEIRRLSKKMVEMASRKVPLIFDMCCGKDEFEEYRRRIEK